MAFNNDQVARHIAGTIKYRTVSNADSSRMDFEQFQGLHQYLKETYPLVHQNLELTVIGRAALLYRWKGKSDRFMPVLFAAHQDVVDAFSLDKWKYPPFEGTVDREGIWGRGSVDCKANIIAHMEAIEELLKEGFQPDYDIYLGYGYNEEVGGGDFNSALAICHYLRDKGVRLGGVIDEGRGVCFDGREKSAGLVGSIKTGEKGVVMLEFSAEGKGGNSSQYNPDNAIVKLIRVAATIEQMPFEYRITPSTRREYQIKAGHMQSDNDLFERIGQGDLEAVREVINHNQFFRMKFQSIQNITSFEGKGTGNVIPSTATMKVSVRTLPGDDSTSVVARYRSLLPQDIGIRVISVREASPESPYDSVTFKLIEEVAHEQYENCLIVPSVLTGGTDARNYYEICDNVYRFGGYSFSGDVGEHGINECMPLKDCWKGPDFFYRFIRKYNERGQKHE